MKNTENTLAAHPETDLQEDGVKIYKEPHFVVTRSPYRRFMCKDKEGKLIAEFKGMANLTDYVCKKTAKSPAYVKQQVYKALNKKIEFLGYYWSDR